MPRATHIHNIFVFTTFLMISRNSHRMPLATWVTSFTFLSIFLTFLIITTFFPSDLDIYIHFLFLLNRLFCQPSFPTIPKRAWFISINNLICQFSVGTWEWVLLLQLRCLLSVFGENERFIGVFELIPVRRSLTKVWPVRWGLVGSCVSLTGHINVLPQTRAAFAL